MLTIRTILRCRIQLGWTFRGSSFCQLIRDVNKTKRLEWSRENIGNTFENVIWSDECTVQAESHRRYCCRKKGERPKNKPRCALSNMYTYAVLSLTHSLTHSLTLSLSLSPSLPFPSLPPPFLFVTHHPYLHLCSVSE